MTNDHSRGDPARRGPAPQAHESRTTNLTLLGWDDAFAAAFAPYAAEGLNPARVAAEHRSGYTVLGEGGERDATLAGRLRHEAQARDELPAVGDWVAVALGAVGPAVIRGVLPRRSAFRRKMAGEAAVAQVVAANVDVALITTALPGDLNVRRLERYMTLAWESGATPVVVLTKTDLCDDLPAAIAAARAAAPGADVVALSALTGDGVADLERHLAPGRTAVLIGSSGVGKSTLANRLLGDAHLQTGAVRGDGKGRHTTTRRELLRLTTGALLIDTPGMRELQLWSADAGLGSAFADIDALAAECRFRDCRHDAEPGCAVRAAVAAGALAAERLAHWHQLRRELAWLETRQDAVAAAAARARNRALHRAARTHIRRKYE